MAFKKGQSGNPLGRPKGSGNSNARVIREKFNEVVENQLQNIDGWLAEIAKDDPKAALDMIVKLAEYCLPKLSRVQSEVEQIQDIPQFTIVEDDARQENKKQEKIIPSADEFISYCVKKQANVDPAHAKLKFDQWLENGWKDGYNKPIKVWKSKANGVIPHLKTIKPKSKYQVDKSKSKDF